MSLRDLPAFLAVGNSLLYKLPRLVRAENGYDEGLIGEFFNGVDTPSQACRTRLNQAAYAVETLDALDTEDIIRAMFVLPMEIERQRSLLEHKEKEIEAILWFMQY